jgi:hypothetical protein
MEIPPFKPTRKECYSKPTKGRFGKENNIPTNQTKREHIIKFCFTKEKGQNKRKNVNSSEDFLSRVK